MHIPKIQEKLNYVPFKIRMRYKETNLAIGTAFIYQHAANTYLVTNWHNVTGRNPKNKETLSDDGNEPDNIVLGIPTIQNPNEQPRMIKWEWKILELYEDQDKKIPVWFRHPVHNENVDVVVGRSRYAAEKRSKSVYTPIVAQYRALFERRIP